MLSWFIALVILIGPVTGLSADDSPESAVVESMREEHESVWRMYLDASAPGHTILRLTDVPDMDETFSCTTDATPKYQGMDYYFSKIKVKIATDFGGSVRTINGKRLVDIVIDGKVRGVGTLWDYNSRTADISQPSTPFHNYNVRSPREWVLYKSIDKSEWIFARSVSVYRKVGISVQSALSTYCTASVRN